MRLGPENATLTVRTGKTGAAAKAGHDLLIEVAEWSATLDLQAGTARLTADSRSLRVLEGSGGIQSLGEDDKASIKESIDSEVLKGGAIAFTASQVSGSGDGALTLSGELDLLGTRRPLTVTLSTGPDGRLSGNATIKQTDWGMKPFSTLFGTLKVADEVHVAIERRHDG
ncbi:MAG TPA: YceI family protein [Solirubrobacteraceae bacterium]|jgi:polyisoprenoid-binding protein YceI|nr:YceI family protein [Solirubrobacteraceae bacterium]